MQLVNSSRTIRFEQLRITKELVGILVGFNFPETGLIASASFICSICMGRGAAHVHVRILCAYTRLLLGILSTHRRYVSSRSRGRWARATVMSLSLKHSSQRVSSWSLTHRNLQLNQRGKRFQLQRPALTFLQLWRAILVSHFVVGKEIPSAASPASFRLFSC